MDCGEYTVYQQLYLDTMIIQTMVKCLSLIVEQIDMDFSKVSQLDTCWTSNLSFERILKDNLHPNFIMQV